MTEKCPICDNKHSYSELYDGYYCKKCNYWLGIICPNKTCEYCSKRPKYPLKINEEKEVRIK